LFSRLTKTMPTLSVANVMTIYFKSTTRGQNRQKAVWWWRTILLIQHSKYSPMLSKIHSYKLLFRLDPFRLPIPVIVMLFTIWDVRNRRHRQ